MGETANTHVYIEILYSIQYVFICIYMARDFQLVCKHADLHVLPAKIHACMFSFLCSVFCKALLCSMVHHHLGEVQIAKTYQKTPAHHTTKPRKTEKNREKSKKKPFEQHRVFCGTNTSMTQIIWYKGMSRLWGHIYPLLVVEDIGSADESSPLCGRTRLAH